MSAGFAVAVGRVRFAYGSGPEVLRDLSLDVPAGQAVALLGPNGVGKTTLTRLVAGLLRPSQGTVAVGDWNVEHRRPDEMARRVGYAFQHADQQLFERTVRQDVGFGPRMLGRGTDGVAAILGELGLAGAADVHPYDLPAPARKLVTLAGVLAMQPGVLLLDEPTAGMDLAMRDVVVQAVRRRSAAGVTVMAVSHDLSFVAEVADRIVVIREGRVATDAPARELLTDEAALKSLGLRPPTSAAISLGLNLEGKPIRREDVVAQLRSVRWIPR